MFARNGSKRQGVIDLDLKKFYREEAEWQAKFPRMQYDEAVFDSNYPYHKDYEYEITDIRQLHGDTFRAWCQEINDYRYLEYSVEDTARHFNIAPHVIKQMETKDDESF